MAEARTQPRLRRKQLLQLAQLLTSDATLANLWYQEIVRYPINAPIGNSEMLPTFALYCTRENTSFATTEQHKRPGAFTALLMFPESLPLPEGFTAQSIYDEMLDTADAIVEALTRIKRDPGTENLWHQIIFGGDSRGATSSSIPVGSFTVQYDRDPGKMQVAVITFMLAANLRG